MKYIILSLLLLVSVCAAENSSTDDGVIPDRGLIVFIGGEDGYVRSGVREDC